MTADGRAPRESPDFTGLTEKQLHSHFDTTLQKSPLALSVVSELALPGKNY